MLFAIDENNIKHEPRPNLHKETPLFCPSCKTSVLSKCGSEKIWHFSHKSTEECDSWSESDPWHLNWQALFPKEQVEIVMENHRADAVSTGGVVIEFQHSYLSSIIAKEREAFYQNMIWVFDAVEPWENGRLKEIDSDTNASSDVKSFYWKSPKSCIKEYYSYYPLLLDVGNNVLIVVYRSQSIPERFEGIYISHSDFIKKATSLAIREAIAEFTDHHIRSLFSGIDLNNLTMPEYFEQRHIILEKIKAEEQKAIVERQEHKERCASVVFIRKDIKILKHNLFIYRESVKVSAIRKEIKTTKRQLIKIQASRQTKNNLILELLKDDVQKVASIRKEIKAIKKYLLSFQIAEEEKRQIFLFEIEQNVSTIRRQIKEIKDYLVKIQVGEASLKIQRIRRQVKQYKKS